MKTGEANHDFTRRGQRCKSPPSRVTSGKLPGTPIGKNAPIITILPDKAGGAANTTNLAEFGLGFEEPKCAGRCEKLRSPPKAMGPRRAHSGHQFDPAAHGLAGAEVIVLSRAMRIEGTHESTSQTRPWNAKRVASSVNFQNEVMKNCAPSNALRSFGQEGLVELKETRAGIVVLNRVLLLRTAHFATLLVSIIVESLAAHSPVQITRMTPTIKNQAGKRWQRGTDPTEDQFGDDLPLPAHGWHACRSL